MYKATDFKNDLLINLNESTEFPIDLISALKDSEFEFEDTSNFTRRKWDTYSRILIIKCKTKAKAMIETYERQLYTFCDRLHGVKNEYMLMGIDIFIKASLDDSVLSNSDIIITSKVTINRKKDYIDSGGFGTIYAVEDEEKGIKFVYKIFDPSPFQKSDDGIMKKRFIREGKKLLSYSHQNIVRAYDFGFLGNDSAYIKLEFVEGENLLSYIKNNDLGSERKTKLVEQYIDAMSYLHSRTDVHRDISYSNILVSKSGTIKVLDFGFSKNSMDTEYDTEYNDILHKFNPPDEKYDIRTEVYCIGAVLFSIVALEEFHISKIRKLKEIDFDERYVNCIQKCLNTNPNDRYRDAIELKNYLNTEPTSCREDQYLSDIDENFSLDVFKECIDKVKSIEFALDLLPTYKNIEEWVEVKLRESKNTHRFISTLNLCKLLMEIPQAWNIETYKNINYEIDKTKVFYVLDSYDLFNDTDRISLLKGIQAIILEKSIESEPF